MSIRVRTALGVVVALCVLPTIKADYICADGYLECTLPDNLECDCTGDLGGWTCEPYKDDYNSGYGEIRTPPSTQACFSPHSVVIQCRVRWDCPDSGESCDPTQQGQCDQPSGEGEIILRDDYEPLGACGQIPCVEI